MIFSLIMKSRKILFFVIACCLAAAAILFFYDPSELALYPKCPFYVVTGYKCPGCGTLRGLHALLHGHLIQAMQFNLLMVLSIPLLGLLILSKKVRLNAVLGWTILAIVLIWWVVRNII